MPAEKKAAEEKPDKLRRAITLGGGGPAAGLHIGVLDALAAKGITFDVWALSCIGAWVGIVYNQFDQEKVKNKERPEKTYQFFRDGVFRDDESYEHFPINTVFGPDWGNIKKSLSKFIREPSNYEDFAWDPYKTLAAFQDSMSIFLDHMPDKENKFRKLDKGDINKWILNQVMAPNPFVRYLTSMMYLSNVTGLSRINYPDSDFMKSINFEELKKCESTIFHNAWNLDDQKLALFCNRLMKDPDYVGGINASTLCACSALPFIEETVQIGRKTYCEGALVDTVNFESLLQEHGDLDEIWISRIVDTKQVRKPKDLHDALANLCQLFAATVGEDDVRLFKYHVKCDEPRKWTGTVVEIHVPAHINFKWNHSNLDHGRALGKAAAEEAIAAYKRAGEKTAKQNKDEIGKARFINENPAKDRKVQARLKEILEREGINKDVLMQAILKAKPPRLDQQILPQKMHWWVDAKGQQVEPNDKGEFPDGSIPYAVFALRNPKVKEAYGDLHPAPDLNLL
ncbi:patatin-like phospholipase family protein [Bradyrhizobium sp. Tv2a-2]|uniref:patatin-like phospholipase family protein n=1 Tax=Bradyrhizobium sp. Tv2a-2 TaxID=113395 RepID=UPI000405D59C|nr:patatin-like phospholipase family protein [Bradyrhizobium sp. Tv2a-2]